MTTKTKKSPLGRGLSTLFNDDIQQADAIQNNTENKKNQSTDATTDSPTGAGGTVLMPIEFLQPGAYQPRVQFEDKALNELAASIQQHGVLQPLLVRPLEGKPDQFEIIAGERRWRASQLIQLHDVPVIIQEFTDSQALEIGLIENVQREDLNTLEEAAAYQRLMDQFEYTQEQLADTVGKSRSHVANTMRLLKLPAILQDYVKDNKLSAGHARTLIGLENATELAQQAIDGNLSVRELEALANNNKPKTTKKSKKSSSQPKKSADLLAIENDISNRLGLNVTIDANGTSGRLIAKFENLDQFDLLLEKLTS